MNSQDPSSRKWLKRLLPPLVILLAIGLSSILVALKPEQVRKEPEPVFPTVEVFEARVEPVRVHVTAQGNVRPRQQTRLTSRVSGQIDWVAPVFADGGTFEEGEVLLRLDPLPYASALAEARSRLALAESVWLQEQEAAVQARRDWAVVGSGEPGRLALREPQLDKAAADLEAARVAVEMATRNLAYAEIRAPYAGRVSAKHVDVGQAIAAQATVLGEIHSMDALEVALPLTLRDLASIGWAGSAGNAADAGTTRPAVRLEAQTGPQTHAWTGYLERTAAAVDERSRMITAWARVDPPFLSDKGAPLKPGQFVSAAIEGRLLPAAVRLPRAALHPGGIVYRLDNDNRLESVAVAVDRTDADWAIVTAGLGAGDRVCLTPLLFFVEGMRVEPAAAAVVERGSAP